jgi:colanic acid/amylovoran biosynthesis protein
MNLLVFAANWYNRGDESAIRAMIDELTLIYPDIHIKIHFNMNVDSFPTPGIEVIKPYKRLAGRNYIKNALYQLAIRTNGKIPYVGEDAKSFNEFIEAVKWADYAVYAPGGPCIGDFYGVRKLLLDMMEILIRNDVPFSLFAPSVGPFTQDGDRVRKILHKAEVLCFRESISEGYYHKLDPDKATTVTLDSAFQHPIDIAENAKKLDEDRDLKTFIETHDKVVGITVTDLKWHRNFKDTSIADQIRSAFTPFVEFLEKQGYSILFIPQLFGTSNDRDYMMSFAGKNSFVMSDQQDCYFQQYIISQLCAVVGMRYHSNIFSAKMGTPFVSVAYEQKMHGFMKRSKLDDYCIDVNDLTEEGLKEKFSLLVKNYQNYKQFLDDKMEVFRTMSYETTRMISESMNRFIGK